jgi:type VI secretion system protein ImpE
LLRAEWRRIEKGRWPFIMAKPVPQHGLCRWRTHCAVKSGDPALAVRWADRAEANSPIVRGFVNGQEFTGLRDVDDRFASGLEAFAGGDYLWFPWESLRRIDLQPASATRDHWVRPAELHLRDGSRTAVGLPLIYPGSTNADGVFATGQETDYISPDSGVLCAIGGKQLLVGDDEVPLRDVQMLELR